MRAPRTHVPGEPAAGLRPALKIEKPESPAPQRLILPTPDSRTADSELIDKYEHYPWGNFSTVGICRAVLWGSGKPSPTVKHLYVLGRQWE